MLVELDDDAFSDAQIASKMMACETIESVNWPGPLRIDLYAGWYGMLAFLLLTRARVEIDRIRSFDLDRNATTMATRLLRHWRISHGKFQAFTFDVNKLKPLENEVDLFVNTSVEHISDRNWYTDIPSGSWVLIQGTNLIHEPDDAPNPIHSCDELLEKYPMEGTTRSMSFEYPGKAFTRFQAFGKKL